MYIYDTRIYAKLTLFEILVHNIQYCEYRIIITRDQEVRMQCFLYTSMHNMSTSTHQIYRQTPLYS